MTEYEIEEFETLKRKIRGDWIARIQMELVKRDANGLLVDIDNHHNFLGMTPDQAAELAIKLYSPLSSSDYGIFALWQILRVNPGIATFSSRRETKWRILTMCLDDAKKIDIDAALAQIKYYLDTFGEHISCLDYSIECLESLKEELPEGDVESINAYLYGALSRMQQTKSELSKDIKLIKGYLSYFVESSEEIFTQPK